MKSLTPILFLFFIVPFFIGCDQIESNDFLQGDGPIDIDTSTIVQKVLIEDFTGYKCTNCPQASTELHTLETLYEGKIIGIAVHAGFFASPGGTFTTDFRTDAGNELEAFFSPQSFPIGMVNRKGYPSNVLIEYTDWASIVTQTLNQDPSVGLKISEADGQLTIQAKRIGTITGNLKLVVCLTEDKIIDKQINGTNLIEDYEHNHVLRTNINGTWGSDIVLTEEYTSFSYSYVLENNWIKSNCKIVAYIYNDSTKEILQAEELHLSE